MRVLAAGVDRLAVHSGELVVGCVWKSTKKKKKKKRMKKRWKKRRKKKKKKKKKKD
jgi:hypothetical protein